MDEQYSPETDENHLKTMRMLSLIMTILLAVAVVASLYAITRANTHDDSEISAGSHAQYRDSQAQSNWDSTQEYDNSQSQSDSSGMAPDGDSNVVSWQKNNPALSNIITQCGGELDVRARDDYTESTYDTPVAIMLEQAMQFTYDSTSDNARQAMTCVGGAIGASDPDIFYQKITSLGRMYRDPPGTDYTRSTLPMIPADGKSMTCASTSENPEIIFCTLNAESVDSSSAVDPPISW